MSTQRTGYLWVPGFQNLLGVTEDGTNLVVGPTPTSLSVAALQAATGASGNITLGASETLGWSGRSTISSPADGNVLLTNNAATSFTSLQFGGTSASFPALKRSTTTLLVRLADDSAFSSIYMATCGANTVDLGQAGDTLLVRGGAATLYGLGGATSSFPALKQNGAALNFRLADDSAGCPVTASKITLDAGTTAVAPINLTSGTNLTSAVAGAMEYDGTQIYGTVDTTSGRGSLWSDQYFKLTADGSTIGSIANFFGTTSNISLVANAHYYIEIVCFYLNTTSGTVTWTLNNSAAPANQNIYYQEAPVTGLVAPPGTATDLEGAYSKDATASRAFTSGTLTTAVDHYSIFRIWLQNGTGTSLQIQATKNVGGTITPRRGSMWLCRRLASGNVGTFAA